MEDVAYNMPRHIALAISFTNDIYAWREQVSQAYSDSPTDRRLALEVRYVWASMGISVTSVPLAIICMLLRQQVDIKRDLTSFRGLLSVAQGDVAVYGNSWGKVDYTLGIVQRVDRVQLSLFPGPDETAAKIQHGEKLTADCSCGVWTEVAHIDMFPKAGPRFCEAVPSLPT